MLRRTSASLTYVATPSSTYAPIRLMYPVTSHRRTCAEFVLSGCTTAGSNDWKMSTQIIHQKRTQLEERVRALCLHGADP